MIFKHRGCRKFLAPICASSDYQNPDVALFACFLNSIVMRFALGQKPKMFGIVALRTWERCWVMRVGNYGGSLRLSLRLLLLLRLWLFIVR